MEKESGEEDVSRDRVKKVKEKKTIKLEKSKTTVSDPSESVIFDPIEWALKNEQKGHLATKEEVKLLRTKLSCLNSDVSELETQLEEKENELLKAKEERDDKINMMKLYIAKKCSDMEHLKALVASSVNPTVMLEGMIRSPTCSRNVAVQTDMLEGMIRSPTCSRNVAVQTDMLEVKSEVIKEEGECDDSPMKKDPNPGMSVKRANKIKLVEDISGLVQIVLKENTKLLQINNALELKMKEITDLQEIIEYEKDNLKEEVRYSQAKVLRLTIDNMRLKQENHKARGMKPLAEMNQD